MRSDSIDNTTSILCCCVRMYISTIGIIQGVFRMTSQFSHAYQRTGSQHGYVKRRVVYNAPWCEQPWKYSSEGAGGLNDNTNNWKQPDLTNEKKRPEKELELMTRYPQKALQQPTATLGNIPNILLLGNRTKRSSANRHSTSDGSSLLSEKRKATHHDPVGDEEETVHFKMGQRETGRQAGRAKKCLYI